MTVTRSLPPIVLGLTSVALACGAGNNATETTNTTRRDSAGVTIVENAFVEPGPRLGWTVSEGPRVDIGRIDGEAPYQLFRVGHALLLDDGRVAVANRGSSEIRLFDPDGQHLDSWGGEGEGPGEFLSALRLAQWPGDSVGVWDNRLRRLTVFTSTGALGRSVDLKSSDQTGFLDWVDVFPDGDFLVTHQDILGSGPSSGVRRPPVDANVLTGTGDHRASLGQQPGEESNMMIAEGRIEVYRYPFARAFTTRRVGDEVIFGPDDRFELRVHSRSGGLQRIVRLNVPERPVTEADVEAETERRIAALPEDRRAASRASQRETPYPETFPAFSDVLVDALGNAWVQRFKPPVEEGPGEWAVFSPDGDFLGWVDTPPGLTPFQIGVDFILGHWSDALEVEHVQIWELTRG